MIVIYNNVLSFFFSMLLSLQKAKANNYTK